MIRIIKVDRCGKSLNHPSRSLLTNLEVHNRIITKYYKEEKNLNGFIRCVVLFEERIFYKWSDTYLFIILFPLFSRFFPTTSSTTRLNHMLGHLYPHIHRRYIVVECEEGTGVRPSSGHPVQFMHIEENR